jgi:hypothetical protein
VDDVASEWRPPAVQRGFVLLVSLGVEVAACVSVVEAFAQRGALSLAPVGLLMAGCGAFGIRYVVRSRITLTRDTLIVTNTFKRHYVPLNEVTGVSATSSGLRISRAGQPPIIAAAAQKSRIAVDTGNDMTRADDIASDIMTARSRLASTEPLSG